MAYERIFEEKDVGIDLIDNDFTQDHCKFSTPLHEAIILDNIEMVKLLLQQGAEIEVKDQNSYTPLLLASYHNRIEIMEILLNHGANVHAKVTSFSNSLLYTAICQTIRNLPQ